MIPVLSDYDSSRARSKTRSSTVFFFSKPIFKTFGFPKFSIDSMFPILCIDALSQEIEVKFKFLEF